MEVGSAILQSYHFTQSPVIHSFGSGLINHTWKLQDGNNAYILQRINNEVFRQPMDIATNIDLVANYFDSHVPGYRFVKPVPGRNGRSVVYSEGEGYFRLFPFVNGSHAKTVVENASQAYEASAQFGKFTKLLSGFDVSGLRITLPLFHDLSFRYGEFKDALQKGNSTRIDACEDLIRFMKAHDGIVAEFAAIKKDPGFKLRVTHHDTKISNVLFDDHDKGLCVIDLDTVMPGYFFSDVGDMMRTYLSPASEEEQDLSKIFVRDDIYTAIVKGYNDEMNDELTSIEKKYFFYAGKFMIYMQALRFLTDHINNDKYYGAQYPDHNLVRARNQATLLKRFLEKEQLYTMININTISSLKDQSA